MADRPAHPAVVELGDVQIRTGQCLGLFYAGANARQLKRALA